MRVRLACLHGIPMSQSTSEQSLSESEERTQENMWWPVATKNKNKLSPLLWLAHFLPFPKAQTFTALSQTGGCYPHCKNVDFCCLVVPNKIKVRIPAELQPSRTGIRD